MVSGREIGMTPDEARHYREFGYVVARQVDPEFREAVEEARRDAEQLLADEEAFARQGAFAAADGRHYQLTMPHYLRPSFLRLMRSAPIAQIVEAVVGPNWRTYVTHGKISYKRLNEESMEWMPHQDNGYKIRRRLGFTMGIFLDDVSVENGAIQVFPRSHLLGTLAHKEIRERGLATQVTLVDGIDIAPVSACGEAGDILVFTADTVHQSQTNRRGGCRPIFLFEIEPCEYAAVDERGQPALVLTGSQPLSFRLLSRLISYKVRAAETVGRLRRRGHPA